MPDFNNAKISHQLTFEGAWPTAVAFCDEDRLCAGNRDGQIFVWDLQQEPVPLTVEQQKNSDLKDCAANTHPVRQLKGHTNGITHLLAAEAGKKLVSSSLDRTIQIWDMTANAFGKEDAVLDIAQRRRKINRDGSNEKEVLSQPGIGIETQNSAVTLNGHKDWIQGCALSSDERRLLTGDDAGNAILWDFPAGKAIKKWQGHPLDGIVSTAVTPDGTKAFVAEYRSSRGSFDRPPAQAKIYSLDDLEVLYDLLKIKFPDVKERDNSYGYGTTWSKWVGRGFVASAFSPDGKILAVGMGGEIGDGHVHLIDADSGEEIRTVSKHKYGVCDVVFTSDGKFVLSSGRDTTLQVIQVSDGKEVATLGKPRGGQFKDWFSAIALNPSETKVATADIGGLINVWSI